MDQFFIFCANYLFIVVFVIAAIYFLRQPRKIQVHIILTGLACALLSYIIALIGGALYNDPRPFVVGHFKPLIEHDTENGFPSDHVLLVSCVSAVMFLYNKGIAALLWALTLLIAIARVYVGVHHPVDVAASMLIVIVVTLVIYFTINKDFLDRLCSSVARAIPF
jgi:undecaprenyl-diphosphatase